MRRLGVVALIILACGRPAAATPPATPTPTPSPTPTLDLLSACIGARGLPVGGRVIELRREGAVRTFGICEWPPFPYSLPDGYTEVKVWAVEGVPDASEASGMGQADRIVAPCTYLEIAYTSASQGALIRVAPFVAQVGAITRIDGSPIPPTGLPFYPARGEVVVFHNLKAVLDTARCLR